MAKTALVILIPLAEEIEITDPVDILRRLGVQVTLAGLNGSDPVTCGSCTKILPDMSLTCAIAKGPYDVIVLPGGKDSWKFLADSQEAMDLLQEQERCNKTIAAICVAPLALMTRQIYAGRFATSFPLVAEEVIKGGVYKYKYDRVVVDGPLITSRGPGTALEWSLAIGEYLVGKEKVDELAKFIVVKGY